uniref:Fibronectin type-III domain-containing protein n=1 Tax=Acanthochromis polyacanthus TaxID=80966 RepID=A0A3Q1ERX1_9TELE
IHPGPPLLFKLQNVAGSASLTLNVRVLDSPGPPSHITVKDVTKNSATVTWDIPDNEGGAQVKNYLVDIRDISRVGWTRLTDKCRRLSYKVSDLEEGGIYFFRITAENEYGIGVPAETKEGTKMIGTISKINTSHHKNCFYFVLIKKLTYYWISIFSNFYNLTCIILQTVLTLLLFIFLYCRYNRLGDKCRSLACLLPSIDDSSPEHLTRSLLISDL